MKKPMHIVVAALVALTLFAPAAMAQEETTIIEETTVYPEGAPPAGSTRGATEGSGASTGGATEDAAGSGGTMGGSTSGTTPDGSMGGADTAATTAGGPLPTSGGPAILAPAVALLLGSSVVAFAVLRRGR